MKILLIALLICPSAFARTITECLDESIETSVVLKISAMSQDEKGSSCNNIDSEEFTELGSHIEDKKRYRDQSVRVFNRTKKFDLNLLSDMDEPSPGIADEARTCAYTNVKNNAALRKNYEDKYPQLKNCPSAIAAFKDSMKKQLALHAPLYELCNIVEKAESEMKKSLGSCRSALPVEEDAKQPEAIQKGSFSNSGSQRSHSQRGTQQ